MIQVRTMIEMVAQHKVLQILVAVQLLIVVIGNRIESCFVLHPQDRYSVASEVTARHSHDMSR